MASSVACCRLPSFSRFPPSPPLPSPAGCGRKKERERRVDRYAIQAHTHTTSTTTLCLPAAFSVLPLPGKLVRASYTLLVEPCSRKERKKERKKERSERLKDPCCCGWWQACFFFSSLTLSSAVSAVSTAHPQERVQGCRLSNHL